MRYAMNNKCFIDHAPRLALDAGNARLNEKSDVPMSEERFAALSELAEALREIHEDLLAEGINLLEDGASASHHTYEDH